MRHIAKHTCYKTTTLDKVVKGPPAQLEIAQMDTVKAWRELPDTATKHKEVYLQPYPLPEDNRWQT